MFITFEGIDGVGKTTTINKIVKKLKSYKVDFIVTKEPGSSSTYKINKQIRKLINSNKSKFSPLTEAILFSADRSIHLEHLIIPALKSKKIVLCDRYFDSTFAYQGSGGKLGVDRMIDLQENITNKFYPDLTFYFDIKIKESIKRLKNRGKKNYFENQGEEFFERVIKGYKEVIAKNPHRFVIIDANKSEEQVFKQVWDEFKKRVLKIK